MEELRKDFDLERKQLREDRERELAETREWKLDILAERNRLRKYIDRLGGQQQDYQAREVHETGDEGYVPLPPRDLGRLLIYLLRMTSPRTALRWRLTGQFRGYGHRAQESRGQS